MSAFWRKFKNKEGESLNISFEGMCREIFRKCHKDENGNLPSLHSNPNHKGLEADPIQYKDEWIGFQAKYFDNNFDYDQVMKSLKKTIEEKENETFKVNIIYIFSNGDYTNKIERWKNILKISEDNKITIKTLCGEELQDFLNDNKQWYLDFIDTYFEGAEGIIAKLTSNTQNNLNSINTVYYLEKVVVNYYHQNTKELKQNSETRYNFIEILNFLIEEGSIQGFRLRDEV